MNKAIVIVGQTATGKSYLAVRIAKKLKGEVISADSRQVYKGIDIGTGKITKKEMKGVPHHLLDVASPKNKFTVAEYKRLAEGAMKDIAKRGKIPIICGGTGFYVDAITKGIVLPEVAPNEKLRESLNKKHGKMAITFSRFVPVIRTFVPIVAGIARMNYASFLKYSLIGSILWSSIVTLLGYFLGQSFPEIKDYMGWVIAFVVFLSVIPIIPEFIKKRKKN